MTFSQIFWFAILVSVSSGELSREGPNQNAIATSPGTTPSPPVPRTSSGHPRCLQENLSTDEAKYFYYADTAIPLKIFTTGRITHRLTSTILQVRTNRT